MVRGGFSKKEVVVALSSNNGDMEDAFDELTKTNAQPFQMKIWGSGSGNDNSDGIKREDEDSDGDYKPASDTFAMFSAPKNLKNIGLTGQLHMSEMGKNKDLEEIKALLPGDIKPELIRSHQAYLDDEDAPDDENDIGDESITQWLIKDSKRPRVKVDVNEEKKLKSVEMIRAALNVNRDPVAEAEVQEPVKKLAETKTVPRPKTPPKKLDIEINEIGATRNEEIKSEQLPKPKEPGKDKLSEEKEPKDEKVEPKPKGNKAAQEVS